MQRAPQRRASLPLAALAVVTAALTSAGCMSYKPVQPLDELERSELASFAPLMAGERVRVISMNEHALDDLGDFLAALELAGATLDDVTPTLTINTYEPWHSLDEPMLLVLSLGFLPHFGPGRRTYRWRLLADAGHQIESQTTLASPHWIGWLVGPIALLPSWKLSATWDPDDDQKRERHSDARRARLALALARCVRNLRDAE